MTAALPHRRLARLGVAFTIAALVSQPVQSLAGTGDAAAAGLIRQAPDRLVVQEGDLGESFALQAGDYQPDGQYVAVFFRPDVLSAPHLPAGDLLGVIASVAVLDTVEAAEEAFLRADDEASVLDSFRRGSSGDAPREVRAVDVEVPGADAVRSFRLVYELAGVPVIEYRHRLRVANAVANLLVSGRAGAEGAEPERLGEQARSIAGHQAVRLAAAGGI